ncbi:MAG TPA: methyltransferase domain-containing protein, partial [Thermoplasmatales archaeon]|nr:methyltransferase domain-containing protein [Thermoplasmatales archaeon]HEX08726.1 methyltransferase domain-containing protein [Thermoplasmatales archaeon]
VDAFDDTVADEIMSATNLKIEDNKVDEIIADQLIEHLGIVGSIYSLSECFRVLKPGGKLIIETPDLQKTLERYIKGDREDRKNLLPWIYGVDIPGMRHRFCYPEDLLEETLEEIGFSNISKEHFEHDKHQPILKIVCEKPVDYKLHQIIATFRKKLLQKEIIDLDNQILSLEQETLIKFFKNAIKNILNNKISVEEVIIEGAVHSPSITSIFLEELKNYNITSDKTLNRYVNVLETLAKLDFPSLLLNIMMQTPGFVGEQHKLFSTITEIGRKTIKGLFSSTHRKIIKNLRAISKEINPDKRIKFFSLKIILLKSNNIFQKGVKEFILENYENAIEKFIESTSVNRDQILGYWNLARLFSLQGKLNEARQHYENTLMIANKLNNAAKIKNAIAQEMKSLGENKFSEPIVSLDPILR